MKRVPLSALVLAATVALPAAAEPPAAVNWKLPIFTKKLPNGLTVVVSPDHSAPTFGISTVYRIGFRLEPKGRTGFAHLFEHMMFEGTPLSPKGTLGRVIQGGGGMLNGSTRYDYTNYIAMAPVSALDAILWLEADRMKGIDFSEKTLKNQQEVVKEEIRVNVLNRPYGLFFWTDVAGKAFDKWENNHDGYGSFSDLDAASVSDVKSFFETYYAVNNAVLSISGDVEPQEIFAKVDKYFGALPSRPMPKRTDFSESPNTAERWLTQSDPLAQVPGIAIGFKLPGRAHRDYVSAAVLGEVLAGGDASRLYQGLVKGKGMLSEIQGGLNWPLGNPWQIEGPSLMTFSGLYKPTTDAKAVTDSVGGIIAQIVKEGVPAEELARVKTKLEADFYAELEDPLGRANELALAQSFLGDAAKLNELPAQIRAVTSEDLQRVAATYLAPTNRTVIDRRPGKPAAPQAQDSK
jgi:zinc protease